MKPNAHHITVKVPKGSTKEDLHRLVSEKLQASPIDVSENFDRLMLDVKIEKPDQDV